MAVFGAGCDRKCVWEAVRATARRERQEQAIGMVQRERERERERTRGWKREEERKKREEKRDARKETKRVERRKERSVRARTRACCPLARVRACVCVPRGNNRKRAGRPAMLGDDAKEAVYRACAARGGARGVSGVRAVEQK